MNTLGRIMLSDKNFAKVELRTAVGILNTRDMRNDANEKHHSKVQIRSVTIFI